MARLNLQNQPTAYPKGIFYTLRICQLLASTVVAGEMFYFIYWLAHGGYKIPWMFFFVSPSNCNHKTETDTNTNTAPRRRPPHPHNTHHNQHSPLAPSVVGPCQRSDQPGDNRTLDSRVRITG